MTVMYDEEALNALAERAETALRPLGLTVEAHQYVVDQQAGLVMALTCTVRDSAATGVSEDKEEQEKFNQMMANDHQRTLDQQRQEIVDAMSSDDALDDVLDGGDGGGCDHEFHEGLCLKCGVTNE